MSNSSGSWLSGPKKLWGSITSEVSNIFTEQPPANRDQERRYGQTGGRSFMQEFDQQLQRELDESNHSSGTAHSHSSASLSHHYHAAGQSGVAQHPSPHYYQQTQQQPMYNESSSYHQQSPHYPGAYNPSESADMGLNTSLPAYQKQQLSHVPSALNDPAQPPSAYHTEHPPAPYAHPTQPTMPSHSAYPQPATTLPAPAQPWSAPPSVPLATNGQYQSPMQSLPTNTHALPKTTLPLTQHQQSYSPAPSQPQIPSHPYYPQSTQAPAPVNPADYSSNAGYAPSSVLASFASQPSSPHYATPPVSQYIGPSFTSSAYQQSHQAGAIALPPPPPPSQYWVQRAQQDKEKEASNVGLGLNHVDYSDLDPKSMDFAYANRR